MKIRTDFVTNSSSSSFVIEKKYLTTEQLEIILDKEKAQIEAEKFNLCTYDDPSSWTIIDKEDRIVGWTFLDNFDWIEFLEKLGVKKDEIEYDAPHSGGFGLDLASRENAIDYFLSEIDCEDDEEESEINPETLEKFTERFPFLKEFYKGSDSNNEN